MTDSKSTTKKQVFHKLTSVGTALDLGTGMTYPILASGAVHVDEGVQVHIDCVTEEWFDALSDEDRIAVRNYQSQLEHQEWLKQWPDLRDDLLNRIPKKYRAGTYKHAYDSGHPDGLKEVYEHLKALCSDIFAIDISDLS